MTLLFILALSAILAPGGIVAATDQKAQCTTHAGNSRSDRQALLQSMLTVSADKGAGEGDMDDLENKCAFGTSHFSCEVPGAKPVCCQLVQSILPCSEKPEGEQKACGSDAIKKMIPRLAAAGFDFSKMGEDEYWKDFCPVMSGLEDAHEQYCTAKPHADESTMFLSSLLSLVKPIGGLAQEEEAKAQCDFGTPHFSCGVPGAKPVCCQLVQSILPCSEKPEGEQKACGSDAIKKMIPRLAAAGFDFSKIGEDEYWKDFCPVMSGLEDTHEQYCTAKPHADESTMFLSSLLSLVKP
jgi:hypothetical protein